MCLAAYHARKCVSITSRATVTATPGWMPAAQDQAGGIRVVGGGLELHGVVVQRPHRCHRRHGTVVVGARAGVGGRPVRRATVVSVEVEHGTG